VEHLNTTGIYVHLLKLLLTAVSIKTHVMSCSSYIWSSLWDILLIQLALIRMTPNILMKRVPFIALRDHCCSLSCYTQSRGTVLSSNLFSARLWRTILSNIFMQYMVQEDLFEVD